MAIEAAQKMFVTIGVILVSLFAIRQYNVYKWGKCKSKRSLHGKTVIVTGANSGIGKATVLELAKRGARVIMACRNFDKVTQAVEDIRNCTKEGELVPKRLDLASLDSVRYFVTDFLKTEKVCHILINNAGVFQCPFLLTQDGFEMQMGVNHLGHFLLTTLLIETLQKSAPSRIIIVSSSLAKYGEINLQDLNCEKNYNAKKSYCNSKLANFLFAYELTKRLKGSDVGIFALTPGHVWTNLGRYIKIQWWKMLLFMPAAYLFVRTPHQGCQTVVHCAVSEELDKESGKYYRDCKETSWYPITKNDVLSRELWALSEKLTEAPKPKIL